MSDDIQIETTPGLPHDLPPGEHILWQGRPEWRALARNTFKLRWLAGYFATFLAAKLFASLRPGGTVTTFWGVVGPIAAAGGCLGVLSLMAWMNARATVYTLTTRRIVMRVGVAFPTSWNFPFTRLAAADVTVRKEGDGDVVLTVKEPDRVAWLHLWPHTHPWQFARTRPTLRAIAEPARVANLLGRAMQSWATAASVPLALTQTDAIAVSAPSATSFEPRGRGDLAVETNH